MLSLKEQTSITSNTDKSSPRLHLLLVSSLFLNPNLTTPISAITMETMTALPTET